MQFAQQAAAAKVCRLAPEDRSLPEYLRVEFDAYLRCGALDHGFLRVVCEHCRAERLLALPCERRGLCPSFGARRMAESAKTGRRGCGQDPQGCGHTHIVIARAAGLWRSMTRTCESRPERRGQSSAHGLLRCALHEPHIFTLPRFMVRVQFQPLRNRQLAMTGGSHRHSRISRRVFMRLPSMGLAPVCECAMTT